MSRPTYRGAVADSRRWDGFSLRPDDIVISTPSKSGTTWMQMLVALLLFGKPEQFPGPLNEMSPWLDMNTRPLEDVVRQLDSQTHRRFIKTHVPLDGVPWDDRVTYLVVGRDPRDVTVSMWHHIENMSVERVRDLVIETVGATYFEDLARPEFPDDPRERFQFEVDLERGDNHTASHLAWVLHHLDTGWQRRHLPNVALFHFADLKRDLPGEIRRLADVLGIGVTTERVEQVARDAALDRMRTRASEAAPAGELGIWKDPAGFFRQGRGGEWRELMTAASSAHYEQRVAELAGPDLAHWAHHGWGVD